MFVEEKINKLIEIVERIICVTSGINPKDAEYLLEQLREIKEG